MNWAGFALLLAAALLGLAWPLWRRRAVAALAARSGAAEAVAGFRARERELAAQLAAGELDPAQHQALLGDAQRQLLRDTARPVDAGARGGWLLGAAGLVVIGLALTGYWHLGAWPDVALREALTDAGQSPAEVAARIRQRLRAVPENATYWLLLARLEQERGDLPAALAAYRRALEREPDAAAVRAEYAQALFLAAGNLVTGEVRAATGRVLDEQPDNPLALGLRGIDAFQQGRYQAAIDAWQRALDGAPASAEAAALATAIAAARERLGGAAPAPLLRIAVALAPDVNADPELPVFVYVREWQGPPMPVAARRLRVADLPAEVAFEAAAGLDPARPLASIDRFEVVARLARSGSAAPGPNDLETRVGPFDRSTDPRRVELLLAP